MPTAIRERMRREVDLPRIRAAPPTCPTGLRVDIYPLRQANYRIRQPRCYGVQLRQKAGRGEEYRTVGSLTIALGQEPVAMNHKRVSFTLDSTLETVNSAEATASNLATEAGFADDEVMKIAMAVREAAINAVLHGNAYDPAKKVLLEFERTSGEFVVTIRDQGKGIDLTAIPDPLAPENLLKTSGRGIFLIRSFMDKVEINPSAVGTEIKLIKHVHGSAVDGKEASQ